MSNAQTIAKEIFTKYCFDKAFQDNVNNSGEPFRAMIYESGVVADPRSIDGSDYYTAIADELESLNAV